MYQYTRIFCFSLIVSIVFSFSGCDRDCHCPTCPDDTEKIVIWDCNYKRGYAFFLDSAYTHNYEWYDELWNHQYDVDLSVDSIKVFIDDGNDTNNADECARIAKAVVNPEASSPEYGDQYQNENHTGFFRLLRSAEYILNKEMGYIKLAEPMIDEWVLAVTYKPLIYRDIPGAWIGHYVTDPASPDTSLLKVIRPFKPRPFTFQETWDLEWRNVYSLGTHIIPENGIDVKVYLDKSGAEDEEDQEGVKFVTIMGLDKFDNQSPHEPVPDGLFDSFDAALLDLVNCELIFPTLRPFDTGFTFGSDSLEIRAPGIYDEANEQLCMQAHKYNIEVIIDRP